MIVPASNIAANVLNAAGALRRAFIAAMLGSVLCASATADSITLEGSTIPMRGVELQTISTGRLFYLDSRGSRQVRPLEEIAVLGFDDLPVLLEAEQALASGDSNVGLSKLLLAMTLADEDIERIWVHRRLAQTHDQRGEFTQSVGHAAAAVALDPSLVWRAMLQPSSQPDNPAWPAAAEAVRRVQAARSAVRDQTLREIFDELLNQLAAIEERALSQYAGPEVDVRRTISGFLIEDIEAGVIPGLSSRSAVTAGGSDASRSDDAPPTELRGNADDPATDADRGADTAPLIGEPAQPPMPTVEPAATEVAGPTAPHRIEDLLSRGMFDAAAALCEQAAGAPGERSIPEFLVQYGRALIGVDRPADAAVMFTRAAVLYPGSAHSVVGLIETAMIYRTTYDQPRTARRLLQTAIDRAEQIQQTALAERAQSLLSDLPQSTP